MTVEALIARYGLAAVFLGSGIEGETVVVAGGLLAHEGYFPLAAAMAAACVGSFAADQLFFAGGRRYRDHRWVKAVRERPAFARALDLLERYPVGFILGFRFIYGFRVVSPVAIGTSRVPARRFLPLNVVAALVWGSVFSLIGYLFGNGLTAFLGKLKPSRETIVLALAALIVVVALVSTARWLYARRR